MKSSCQTNVNVALTGLVKGKQTSGSNENAFILLAEISAITLRVATMAVVCATGKCFIRLVLVCASLLTSARVRTL